jgi:hypothetical protein
LAESKYFRTLFIYNNPESLQTPGYLKFYSFSKNGYILHSALPESNIKNIIDNRYLTKVLDTASFDFKNNQVKPERAWIKPDIIWHKNFLDLQPFIKMAEEKNLRVEMLSSAFTTGHSQWFFFLRIQGSEILHLIAGYSFTNSKLLNAKFEKTTPDFFEMVFGKEHHINNFFHDIMGIPYLLNLTEMIRDAESYLEKAKAVKEKGMPPNTLCICGSRKKWKYCHGY